MNATQRERFWLILIVLTLLALGLAVVTSAEGSNQPPPVEAHWQVGNTLRMYDCYPRGLTNRAPLTVYLNLPDGTVAYACVLAYETNLWPLNMLWDRNLRQLY